MRLLPANDLQSKWSLYEKSFKLFQILRQVSSRNVTKMSDYTTIFLVSNSSYPSEFLWLCKHNMRCLLATGCLSVGVIIDCCPIRLSSHEWKLELIAVCCFSESERRWLTVYAKRRQSTFSSVTANFFTSNKQTASSIQYTPTGRPRLGAAEGCRRPRLAAYHGTVSQCEYL